VEEVEADEKEEEEEESLTKNYEEARTHWVRASMVCSPGALTRVPLICERDVMSRAFVVNVFADVPSLLTTAAPLSHAHTESIDSAQAGAA